MLTKEDTSQTPQTKLQLTPSNLIVYNIFEQKKLTIPTDLEQLNYCVNCLQNELFETNNKQTDLSPFIQQNVVEQGGTVRIQGLFDTSTIGFSNCLNKLSGSDGRGKIAIKASEGNPNGTLACSLSAALQYLTENTNIYTPEDVNKKEETIKKIYGAARGSTGKDKTKSQDDVKEGSESAASDKISDAYKGFGEDLLTTFWDNVTKESNLDDRLSWIMRVYGPLLNKGLSDISQAGELAKYYILRFLSEKQTIINLKVKQNSEDTETEFWEITNGLPSLAAFSSDTIASVLGVRIQNLFQGQFQSILPRKLARSRASVIYIPYKYIALMGVLNKNKNMSINYPQESRIEEIKTKFIEKHIQIMSLDGENTNTFVDVFSNVFFMDIRELVNNIYKYYKLKNNNVFSKNILDIIDEIINDVKKNINFNNKDTVDIFIKIINSFNIFVSLYNISPNETPEICFEKSLEKVKALLINFGVFIKNLSDFVNDNDNDLTTIIDTVINSDVQENIYNFPSWTGILYSTVAYFNNCYFLNNKNPEKLLELYLQISETEESCAEQDTDYGHDQNVDKIQEIGIAVANVWLDKREQNGLRNISKKIGKELVSQTPDSSFDISSSVSSTQKKTTKKEKIEQKTFKREFDEREFSKNLIDKLKYCSVVLTYNIDGEPSLQTLITKDPDLDYMFNNTIPGKFATRYANNIEPIGNMETWGSIDYTVGDPSITITKHRLNEPFLTHKEFITYIKSENMIEIRTPATNFDAAAPSGCLFKTTEKMCISYRKFTPIPGSGDIDKKEYMYVILTYDLNNNFKNDLSLDIEACTIKNQQANLFIEGIVPSDDITEMMFEFSRKYEQGNQLNNAWRTMWNLLETYYKTPGSEIKVMINTYENIPFIKEIKGILNEMDKLRIQASSKKGFTVFRQMAVPNLLKIIQLIGDYYKDNCINGYSNEGWEEKKGENNCNYELIKKLMIMLNESNKKTNLSLSKKKVNNEVLSEINQLEAFLQIVEKNKAYKELLGVAYSILSLKDFEERQVPKKNIEQVKNMLETRLTLSTIKRFSSEINKIISRVINKYNQDGIPVNMDKIIQALAYMKMFAQEENIDFNNYPIEYKVELIIIMIDRLDDFEKELEAEKIVEASEILENLKKRKKEDEEMKDEEMKDEEMKDEEMKDEEIKDEEMEQGNEDQISENKRFKRGGKKTNKKNKKNKNKLTKKQINYNKKNKNDNTKRKQKNIKHKYTRSKK